MKAFFKDLLAATLLFVLGICLLSLFSISAQGDLGWGIDLFCQHGGLGENVESNPFIVGSQIFLSAVVTYNQKPVQSIPVTFQVNNPHGSPLLTATAQTNSSGYATINFTITRNNYPSFPSLWESIATTSPAQETISDTMSFLLLSLAVGGFSSPIQASAMHTFITALFIELLIVSALSLSARCRGRRVNRSVEIFCGRNR